MRNLRLLAIVMALAVTSVACADDDAPAAVEPVEITMVDFAFEGLPENVAAGTRLRVANAASSELHEVVAFRLPDGEDRTSSELAALPPQELVGALGEPVTVLLAAPGGDQIPAVGDGTLAEAGRYALFCFIPTGVDPQHYLDVAAQTEQGPPQVDGGPPHFVHGMHAELTVE